jgi:uncharacterized protein (DUF58 family)
MNEAAPLRQWLVPTGERLVFTKLLTLYAAAGVIALVGWVLNVGQLYWMAAALGLLPTAGRLVAALEQRGVEVQRRMPSAAHQGDRVTVRLEVRNHTPLPKLHLSLLDSPPPGLEPDSPEPLPVHLAPHGRDSAEYTLRLRRRGYHTLERVQVLTTDPLGLVQQAGQVTLPSRILVYPRVVALPPQALPPDIGGGSAPIDTAERKGAGASFFGIREYRPGDPLRHVHWRTAARLGRLAVVEWEAEESREALLAVDTQPQGELDLGPGTSLDLAAGLAASLAAHLLAEHHAVRLLAPGTAEGAVDRAGMVLPDLLEALARMKAHAGPGLPAALSAALPHLRPGTLICWLTAQPDAATAETCRLLRAAGFPVAVYALRAAARAPGERGDPALALLESEGARVFSLYRNDPLTVRLLD